MMTDLSQDAALAALAALSHDKRLDVFRLLIRHSPHGLLAGDIARHMEMRPNTLSSNLKILCDAGMITRSREGRGIRYRANIDQMQGLISFLADDCCGKGKHSGGADICAPLCEDV